MNVKCIKLWKISETENFLRFQQQKSILSFDSYFYLSLSLSISLSTERKWVFHAAIVPAHFLLPPRSIHLSIFSLFLLSPFSFFVIIIFFFSHIIEFETLYGISDEIRLFFSLSPSSSFLSPSLFFCEKPASNLVVQFVVVFFSCTLFLSSFHASQQGLSRPSSTSCSSFRRNKKPSTSFF